MTIQWPTVALAVGLAFIITGHSWWVPVWLREWSARHPVPHWRGRVGYGLLTLIAIWVFPGLDVIVVHPITLVILGYLSWISASILWAEDQRLSIKRVLQMGIVTSAAFSIASRFSFEECVAILAVSTCVFLGLGVCEGLRDGFLDAETGRFFGGVAGPAKQGTNCVIFIFSTAYLTQLAWLTDELGVALVLGANALLYLTGARSPTWAGLVGICAWLASSLYAEPGHFPWLISGIPGAFLLVGALLYVVTIHRTRYTDTRPNPVIHILHLSRDPGELMHMTGRTTIWRYVLDQIQGRWVTGSGYGAFWTEQCKDAYPGGWRPMSSHSAYVEALANTGIVGLVLWLTIVCLALTGSLAMPSPHGQFVLAFLVFVIVHGITGVAFVFGEFDTFSLFLLVFGLCTVV